MGNYLGKTGGISADLLGKLGLTGVGSLGASPTGTVGAQSKPRDPGEGDPSSCLSAADHPSCNSCCDQKYTPGSPEHAQCLNACANKNWGSGPGGGGSGGGGGATEGDGPAYEGCVRGKFYGTDAGSCEGGYVYVSRSTVVGSKTYSGRCECQKWCLDIGYASDCVTKTGTDEKSQLGEYDFPPELKDLISRFYGRAGEFMNRKPGYGASTLATMFGQNYDKVRQSGLATNQATEAGLQSEGMLGTGAGQGAMQKNAWNTEANVDEVKRTIAIANEAQKRQDLTTFSDAAQKLAGFGLSAEQIREAINAGRRGEGQASLALLLQYMLGMANSWKS